MESIAQLIPEEATRIDKVMVKYNSFRTCWDRIFNTELPNRELNPPYLNSIYVRKSLEQ